MLHKYWLISQGLRTDNYLNVKKKNPRKVYINKASITKFPIHSYHDHIQPQYTSCHVCENVLQSSHLSTPYLSAAAHRGSGTTAQGKSRICTADTKSYMTKILDVY